MFEAYDWRGDPEEQDVFKSVRVDNVLSIVIAGRFDGSLAPDVHEALDDAVSSGVDHIVIDLCDATEVDDGAIAVLSAAASQTLAAGGQLYIALGPEHVVQIHDAALVRSVFG